MKLIRILLYSLILALLLNACQKEYSNESGNLALPSGTWQFKDSANATFYVGNMDSAIISLSTGNTQELHLFGKSLDGSQTFDMQLFADTLKTGTYKASLFQSTFTYSEPAKTLYQADQLAGEFIVTITSFTNTLVTGTFTGIAIDSGNTLKTITTGKFTSTIGGPNGNTASLGVLGDSSGNCKPITLAGIYQQGVALTSANTVQAQVTVATPGTYTISSNTVNGITFSATGTFLSVGVQNVILSGTGTPVNVGDQNYTIAYGNSQCAFKVTFAVPATGTLGGGGGSCTPFTMAGTYQQGMILTASNTVQIQVNVATVGSYNITTNLSNGVTFSKAGIFATTGVQTVTLVGSGTPINAGLQNFTVSFGTSTCTFGISFLSVVPLNYFPTTAKSNWTYSLTGGTSTDSIHTAVISYAPVFGGTTYTTIAAYDVPPIVAYDSFYYRKPGSDYYQYINYSHIIPFDQDVSGEFIFLKDNQPVNYSWSSPNISGTIGSVAVTATIKMTILYKGAVTIGTYNFPDVIKVQYEYSLAGFPTVLETDQRWFANNVGEIYDNYNDGSSTTEYNIGGWFVY